MSAPRFAPERLRAFCEDIGRAADLPDEASRALSDSLVFAQCRGIVSHGLVRLPQYLRRVEAGVLDPRAEMVFTMDAGAVARLDARNGFGQLAGQMAARKAEELAERYGIGMVGVANSNHFGTGAWFAMPSAEKGFFALNLSSASPAMAPYGAGEPLLGTDPVSLALPRKDGQPPLCADMALAAAARGRIRLAALRGEPIPLGWGLDENGQPTEDPEAVLRGGSLLPAGDAKGSALAIFVELLCAVLTGSGLLGDTGNLLDTSRPARTGHVFLCADTRRFLPAEELAAGMEASLGRIRTLTPTGAELLLPGEREERNTEESIRRGAPVEGPVLRELNALAARLHCPPLDG